MHIVDGHREFESDFFVVLGAKDFAVIFSDFVAIEAILKSKTMRN